MSFVTFLFYILRIFKAPETSYLGGIWLGQFLSQFFVCKDVHTIVFDGNFYKMPITLLGTTRSDNYFRMRIHLWRTTVKITMVHTPITKLNTSVCIALTVSPSTEKPNSQSDRRWNILQTMVTTSQDWNFITCKWRWTFCLPMSESDTERKVMHSTYKYPYTTARLT